jgi:hypothetical protein
MYPVGTEEHLYTVLSVSEGVPYAILAASVSLGIALAAGFAAVGFKSRAGLPHLRSHRAIPFPGAPTQRHRPHLSLHDMATAHLAPLEPGEAGAAQAPASIDPPPSSSDPFDEASGASPEAPSPNPSPLLANGSVEMGLPQGDEDAEEASP